MNLDNVPISEIMSVNLLNVTEDMHLKEVERYFSDLKITGAPVIGVDKNIIGWISDTDIIHEESSWKEQDWKLNAKDFYSEKELQDEGFHVEDYNPIFVGQVMTRKVISIKSSDSLSLGIQKIIKHKIHRLIVLDNHHIEGILSIHDILSYFYHLNPSPEFLKNPISDLMKKNIITVESSLNILKFEKILFKNHIHGAPIVNEQNHLVGIASISDLIAFESTNPRREKHSNWNEFSVADILTPIIIESKPSETTHQALKKMLANNIHRLIITENKFLIGIFSGIDLLQSPYILDYPLETV